ncbi:MAG: Crp/Fnr family transcriptional regulator [Acidimicrobiales bacterium]
MRFLAGSSDEDWALIRRHSETRRFLPGDVVISAGESDRALYIVVDGTLQVVRSSGFRGRTTEVARTIHPGSVIGEMAFLDGKPRSALVQAVSEAHLMRLSFDSFEVLAAKDPALARSILLDLGRILADRIRALQRFETGHGAVIE